jgi:hypothetical protein
MVTATVVSLEQTRQEWARAQARSELHEQLDQWLDRLEQTVNEDTPSLQDLTEAVFAERQELTGAIAKALVEQRHAQALGQKSVACPGCGRLLHARDPVPRTVETMVGEVSLERPYFYCVRCEKGFYPLDEALLLSERTKQWDIQKAAAKLAAEVPYEKAQELFKELTGLSLSDHTAHEVVEEVGGGLGVLDVSPSTQEVSERVAEVAKGRKWRPVMVLAIDGAFVPTRPQGAKGPGRGKRHERARRARWQGEWREAKGFRFYLVDRDRIVHVLSWHQIQTDEQLAEALRQVKEAGLVPEDKVRLCVIGDGARWIWDSVGELFPSAVAVLDYYHCAENLHKVVMAQFGDDPDRQREWVEATKARLFFGCLDWVVEDLEKMKPRDEQAAEEIRKLIGYLVDNAERVDYGSLRRGGYPIGSGGIESANKAISHVRLKRSGAWWYVKQANEMLALRCAEYNETFDRVFEAYKLRMLTDHAKDPS